jgi:hypothetical protein
MTTESFITKTPENTSLLQATKYTFTVPNLPFAKYFCQSVVMPGVSTGAVPVSSPFSDTFRHGVKLTYEELRITFIVDEDLRAWQETYNWLRGVARPTKHEEYIKHFDSKASIYYDGILTINTNSNLPNVRFKFKDCHPVSLSGITFNTADSADNTITADLGIRYDYFDIERL